MKTFKVFERNGIKVANSRDICKTIDLRHADYLKVIRECGNEMDESVASENYIPDTYEAENGKDCPCYLVTEFGVSETALKLNKRRREELIDIYFASFNKSSERPIPRGFVFDKPHPNSAKKLMLDFPEEIFKEPTNEKTPLELSVLALIARYAKENNLSLSKAFSDLKEIVVD